MIRCIGYLALFLMAACGGGAKNQSSASGSVGLAAGTSHTCALANGAVRCWGRNVSGQLGTGTFTTGSLSPVAVSGISTATAIAAGGDHTCGVLADGTGQCWGRNDSGQLGNGSLISAASPGQVNDLTTAATLAAGDLHTCALLANGTVKCWGANSKGQVGNNAPLTTAPTPVEVTGFPAPAGTTVTALAAGGEHTCAVLSDGTVNCWGKNDLGQLGNNTFTAAATATPQEVKEIGILTNVPRATAVAAGAGHTCALLANATVRCWGSNSKGQLGATTATPSPCGATACSTTPLPVSGISNVIALAAGREHTCVRLLDNTLTCWGSNSNGQLGNGTFTNSLSPTVVTGISTATAFAAGGSHTCARLADGTLRCWGKNDAGQLGNGETTAATTPVAVIAAFVVLKSPAAP